MSRWSALHVYLHGGPAQVDHLLREHVVPTTTDLLARKEISSWFFVRYWAGGPHLRWRLADAAPATLQRVRQALVAAARQLPPPEAELTPADWYRRFGDAEPDGDTGWQAHGTVLERPYEPEIERYGGPEAIGPAENLFAASSRVAATLLNAAPARRRSTTVDLLFAFLAAADLAGVSAAAFLRGYANGWALVAESADADLGSALRLAEQDFHLDPTAYRDRRRRIAELVTERRGAPTSVNFWADATATYAARLRELSSRGKLGAPLTTILASQLHMLHNRLGLGIAVECHLAWLAANAYLDASPEPDVHTDGPAAADRVYHERSKFVPVLWPTQHPHALDPAGDQPRPVGDVPLPEPTPGALASTSLAEALLARRSRYDFHAADLDSAELSRLLYYAAGERGTPPRRAYPSAGALASTRLMVLPRHVAGVPSALYEYLPHEHSLARVAPDPGVARLAGIAPQFSSGDPDSIDVATVALWIFVVMDRERLRRRYGVRSYRFAIIETGHLAQNVLLAATAAGISALPVGGFFDDHLDHLLLLDGLNSNGCYAILLGPGPTTPAARVEGLHHN